MALVATGSLCTTALNPEIFEVKFQFFFEEIANEIIQKFHFKCKLKIDLI